MKLLENIKQGFKRRISWNKYRSEITTQLKNYNLDYLIDPTFRNINRLFILSLKNGNNDPTRNSFDKYYLLSKITSQERPENVPEKCPDIFKTSPNGPICNAKGRILSGTSLGRTQDISLTIIHKIDFYGFFSIFPDSNCISDNALPK